MSEFGHDYRKQVIDALNAKYQNAYDHGRREGGLVVVEVDVVKGVSCRFFMGRKSLLFVRDYKPVPITNVADVLRNVDLWIKSEYPNYTPSEATQVCLSQGRMSGKCSYRLYEYISTSLRSVGWTTYDYKGRQFEIEFDHTIDSNAREIEKLLANGVIAV